MRYLYRVKQNVRDLYRYLTTPVRWHDTAQEAGNMGIIQDIPAGLHEVVLKNLLPSETIIFQLKGAFKEALVCTDRRVIIAKSGFMTGQIFGSDIFQLSYASIASAQVKMHLFTGFFEVSAGGMQNTDKSYWATKGRSSAAQQPNSVALNSRAQAEQFRAAASFIMERSNGAGSVAALAHRSGSADVGSELERLWSLKEKGALSQAEYDQAKARLLDRNAPSQTNGARAAATGFDVTLVDAGRSKLNTIKVFREVTGAGLRKAKDAVEGTPTLIFRGISQPYAQNIQAKFLRIGATVEVSASDA